MNSVNFIEASFCFPAAMTASFQFTFSNNWPLLSIEFVFLIWLLAWRQWLLLLEWCSLWEDLAFLAFALWWHRSSVSAGPSRSRWVGQLLSSPLRALWSTFVPDQAAATAYPSQPTIQPSLLWHRSAYHHLIPQCSTTSDCGASILAPWSCPL